METPNYYSVIPAEVRYSKQISANEKLMYGEVSALSNKNGYCNASNGYFAELFEVDKKTVSRWINRLEKVGFLNVRFIFLNREGTMSERRIYINDFIELPHRKIMDTPPQNNGGGIHKKVEQNITSINNNKKEEEKKKIVNFYENNVTLITQIVSEDMDHYLNKGLTADLMISVMTEAVIRNKRNWKYIASILENCYQNNIKTAEQFAMSQQEFKEQQANKTKHKKETQKQEVKYNTDFSDYQKYIKKEKST